MNTIQMLLKKPFSLFTIEEKEEIKRLGRPTPELPELKLSVKSGSREFNRKFNKKLYTKCDWLCGCEVKNALFCFPCVIFNGEEPWAKTGFKDLSHLALTIKKHETSCSHINNSLKLALLGCSGIAEKLDSAYRRNIAIQNEQVKQNRLLNIIINCIRFCGAFEFALHGHDESKDSKNPGIFRGLIDFSSELDSVLKIHLDKVTAFTGTSKTIQNELLQVMLEVCQEKISEEIKEANYIALIADETSDVSTKFQIAIVFRYIIKGKPFERFWTFLNPSRHDVESLASCILTELNHHKLKETPQKLIAQTYDGASVMSGVSNGVQVKLKEYFPDAQYVHCHAHQLNLVMTRAASVNRNVRIFFANVHGLCTFLSTSPQRTAILNEIVQKRLHRSTPTKWNFESRCVTTIHEHRQDLVQCMKAILESDDINNDCTISQASGFLKTLTNPNFIFWLSFFSKIFPIIDIFFYHLLKVVTDPAVTGRCLTRFEESITKIKNSIIVNSDKDEEKSLKSFATRKKIDKSEWNRESIEVCNVVLNHIKERFRFSGHLTASALFMPQNFSKFKKVFPENILKSVCSSYKELNEKKFHMELKTLYAAEEVRNMSGALSLYNFINEYGLGNTFSESKKMLEILITIPMTSSEPDRCFSTLKRIKTFSRNTMTEERLTALAMISIEKDLIMDIPDFNQKVIDKFVHLKNRTSDGWTFFSNGGTKPPKCAAKLGNDLSEPGPSSQVQPFTFVDVVCENEESSSPKRMKIEAPEWENVDMPSNVLVKMEMEDDEHDCKNFLPSDLHISDVAIPHTEFATSNVTILRADSSTFNVRLADSDESSMLGEHVAQSLRALTHDCSKVKLKMLIDKAIKEVIKSDLLLSKS